jgi:hypothetical protein
MRVPILFTLLSTLAVTGCGNPTISVKGHVVDEKGQPVADAEVKFTGSTEIKGAVKPLSLRGSTAKNGSFSMGTTDVVTGSRFTLEVSHEGFQKHREEVSGPAIFDRTITLKRAEKNE